MKYSPGTRHHIELMRVGAAQAERNGESRRALELKRDLRVIEAAPALLHALEGLTLFIETYWTGSRIDLAGYLQAANAAIDSAHGTNEKP